MTENAFWNHATCVVVGESGILVCGPSGSGKSSLALALLDAAGRDGRFARLVGDDRVWLRPAGGRLVASGHPALAGKLEIRGLGLVTLPVEPACVVRLVIECGAEPSPRLPEAVDLATTIGGVVLPRHVAVGPDSLDALRVLWRLRGTDDTLTTVAGSNGRI